MNGEERRALQTRVAAHPNVTLQGRGHDMRRVYAATKCLLVPSQWEEAWGRVATEAQFSGIPVIASDRGGLPEAVGPGGTILAHDAPAAAWATAVREYWQNPESHRAAAQAALDYARRPEIDPRRQVAELIAALQDFVASRRPGSRGPTVHAGGMHFATGTAAGSSGD